MSVQLNSVLAENLTRFKIGRYEFKLRSLQRTELPEYPGSTLRGALGWALQRLFCTRKNTNCQECILRQSCGYTLLFETTGSIDGIKQAPRPFIFHFPPDTGGRYDAGEYLNFSLTLVGRAIDYIPYFIIAFEEIGSSGLGKNSARFVLEEVVYHTGETPTKLYQPGNNTLPGVQFSSGLEEINNIIYLWKSPEQVKIKFITPGRLVQRGQLVNRLTFEILVRSLLRRVTWLGRCHCGVQLELDFKSIIQQAGKVTIISDETKWLDWERYSNRQQRRMKLGGIMGEITCGAGWQNFTWLLALGQLLHVGKGATFGLGQYQIIF